MIEHTQPETVERHDNKTRTVEILDAAGKVISSRPFTAEENADLDARLAERARQAEHSESETRVRAIVEDLKAERDRAQVVLDTPNATINASPAGYVKELARASKRISDATIDLAKYAGGQ